MPSKVLPDVTNVEVFHLTKLSNHRALPFAKKSTKVSFSPPTQFPLISSVLKVLSVSETWTTAKKNETSIHKFMLEQRAIFFVFVFREYD